ncbi:MAG: hypothetical protein R3E68_16620 [Burkholderiaceae bacterium]
MASDYSRYGPLGIASNNPTGYNAYYYTTASASSYSSWTAFDPNTSGNYNWNSSVSVRATTSSDNNGNTYIAFDEISQYFNNDPTRVVALNGELGFNVTDRFPLDATIKQFDSSSTPGAYLKLILQSIDGKPNNFRLCYLAYTPQAQRQGVNRLFCNEFDLNGQRVKSSMIDDSFGIKVYFNHDGQ